MGIAVIQTMRLIEAQDVASDEERSLEISSEAASPSYATLSVPRDSPALGKAELAVAFPSYYDVECPHGLPGAEKGRAGRRGMRKLETSPTPTATSAASSRPAASPRLPARGPEAPLRPLVGPNASVAACPSSRLSGRSSGSAVAALGLGKAYAWRWTTPV